MTCAILLMPTCHTVPGAEGNRVGAQPSGLLPYAEFAAHDLPERSRSEPDGEGCDGRGAEAPRSAPGEESVAHLQVITPPAATPVTDWRERPQSFPLCITQFTPPHVHLKRRVAGAVT